MEELIQIVDDSDQPLRGASVSEAHKHGLRHRVVHALVWDMQGRLLVQRRHPDLRIYPNHWGTSAAGYAFENERYDVAVMRKLAEELGLANLELKDIGTYNSDEELNGLQLKRVNKIFESEVPAEAELRVDPEKIIELRWLTPDELQALLEDAAEPITPGLREVIVRYI
jgi:isopentenyldiphosphate isomerase